MTFLVRPATAPEYRSLVVAALVFVLSLVVCYMCIQLFHMRRGARPTPRLSGAVEPFCARDDLDRYELGLYARDDLGPFRYFPQYAQITTGAMPSIETESYASSSRCSCPFGVPP